MKKTMIVATLVVAASTMFAVEKLNPETATEVQYRAALADILAQTNRVQAAKTFLAYNFYSIENRSDLDALRLEADEALVSNGANLCVWARPVKWPKASAAGRNVNGASTNLTYSISLASKLKCSIGPYSYEKAGAAVDEIARMLGEFSVGGWYCDMAVFEQYKATLQRTATKTIKRRLRELGKSFVTKNGVNPVEQYLTRLNTALNAPYFSGLNEWLEKLEYKERIDLSGLPVGQELSALKEAVLYGDKPMSTKNKTWLYVCLGVDGYNAFVKEYNGDKE